LQSTDNQSSQISADQWQKWFIKDLIH
jgi:hypothetical protein